YLSSRDHRAVHSVPTRRSSDLWRNQQIFVQNFYSVRLFEGHSQFDEIKVIRGCKQFVYLFIRQTSLLFQGLSESPRPRILVSCRDRKSTRLNSSHQIISYAVFC